MDRSRYRPMGNRSAQRFLIWAGVLAFLVPGSRGATQTTYRTTSSDIISEGTLAQRMQLRRVSLSVRDSSLAGILKMLTTQAEVGLVYNVKDPRFRRLISLTVTNMDVQSAVQRALQGTGLTAAFASDGETIVIRSPNPTSAQDTSVMRTGVIVVRVLDSASGQRMRGATVTVTGTKISGITDANGELRLQNVPTGEQRIVIRMFGYQSLVRTVEVNSKSPVNVVGALGAIPTTLSGVVTTTTGTQRKMEIGNAIASINVDSVMQVAPVSSLTDLLENRVTGLTVLRGSGQPGDPSRIRLRGASSINNSNDIIVIVDGIRVESDPKSFGARSYGSTGLTGSYLATSPFDLIDPNTIETIDVFKGPSAAAMYGSDAANGVIVITTKRGRPGTTQVSVAVNHGLTYMPGTYPNGSYSFGYYNNGLGGDAYGRCSRADAESNCRVDSIVKYQALNDPYYTVLGRGRTEAYSGTVSGGSGAVRYSFTGSTQSETGLLKMSTYLRERYLAVQSSQMPNWMRRPDRYQSWSGSGKMESQIRPTMRLTITTGVSKTGQRKTALGNSGIAYWMTKFIGDTVENRNDLFYERATRDMMSYTNSIALDWTAWQQVEIMVNGGLNATNTVDETYLPEGFQGASVDFGTASAARAWNQQRSLNGNVRFPVGTDLLTLIVGATYTGRTANGYFGQTDSLPKGISRPSRFLQNGNTSSSIATRGWYVEPRFNVRSRFFVMPGFRLDHNGLSGSRAGGFALPKMNTSWILSDEEFFPWKSWIDLLRVRFAGGFAGTQPGVTDRLRTVKDLAVNETVDISYNGGVSYASLGNTQLQPERSRELEGGFDLDLWKGRAGIVYTYYQKVRRDAIEETTLPPSATLGAARFAQNIGTIRNVGQELEVRLVPIESRQLTWASRTSLTQNRNKVTRLRAGLLPFTRADGIVATTATTKRVVEGYPLWGVWSRPLLGFNDTDRDGRIARSEITLADSAEYLGQPDPKGTLSWSNDIRLLSGQLGITTMMSYEWGMLQISDVMRDANSPFNTAVNTVQPTLLQQALAQAVRVTVHPVAQVVNTFRFQSLSINYTVPRNLARKLGGRSVSIAIQGNNLGLKSNYMGKDPNVGSTLMMSGATIDTGLLSQPRKWQLRIQWGNH